MKKLNNLQKLNKKNKKKLQNTMKNIRRNILLFSSIICVEKKLHIN